MICEILKNILITKYDETNVLKLSICEIMSSEIQITTSSLLFSLLKLAQEYSVLERHKRKPFASNTARRYSKFTLILLDSATNTMSSIKNIHH